ncbi:hypothetical protein K461DRAFT_289071 [Myriangium duriaei CBS 260.36]|uniref:Ig-like domain-containing protein n=1 Tax=Myriangium duriaei CBS 260.36 TaxID=1168546 RepID=A0A9P4J9R8_9PEZI|nr:hypothetical protein K461DRAFT_289071 [Myriangium duriaei CBS 260.36]
MKTASLLTVLLASSVTASALGSQSHPDHGLSTNAKNQACSRLQDELTQISKHITHSIYFCKFYLGSSRNASPLPAINATGLASSCECILQQNNVAIPSAGKGGTPIGSASSFTCNTRYKAAIQAEFTYPKSACIYMQTLPLSALPIAGMTMQQIMEGARCVLNPGISSTKVSTKNPVESRILGTSSARTTSRSTTKTTTSTSASRPPQRFSTTENSTSSTTKAPVLTSKASEPSSTHSRGSQTFTTTHRSSITTSVRPTSRATTARLPTSSITKLSTGTATKPSNSATTKTTATTSTCPTGPSATIQATSDTQTMNLIWTQAAAHTGSTVSVKGLGPVSISGDLMDVVSACAQVIVDRALVLDFSTDMADLNIWYNSTAEGSWYCSLFAQTDGEDQLFVAADAHVGCSYLFRESVQHLNNSASISPRLSSSTTTTTTTPSIAATTATTTMPGITAITTTSAPGTTMTTTTSTCPDGATWLTQSGVDDGMRDIMFSQSTVSIGAYINDTMVTSTSWSLALDDAVTSCASLAYSIDNSNYIDFNLRQTTLGDGWWYCYIFYDPAPFAQVDDVAALYAKNDSLGCSYLYIERQSQD